MLVLLIIVLYHGLCFTGHVPSSTTFNQNPSSNFGGETWADRYKPQLHV
jgi:hypothetical protein